MATLNVTKKGFERKNKSEKLSAVAAAKRRIASLKGTGMTPSAGVLWLSKQTPEKYSRADLKAGRGPALASMIPFGGKGFATASKIIADNWNKIPAPLKRQIKRARDAKDSKKIVEISRLVKKPAPTAKKPTAAKKPAPTAKNPTAEKKSKLDLKTMTRQKPGKKPDLTRLEKILRVARGGKEAGKGRRTKDQEPYGPTAINIGKKGSRLQRRTQRDPGTITNLRPKDVQAARVIQTAARIGPAALAIGAAKPKEEDRRIYDLVSKEKVKTTTKARKPSKKKTTAKKKTPSDFERYGLTDQPIKRAKDIRITSTKKKTPKHADEFLGTETVKRAKKAAADKKSTAASKKLRDVPPRKTQRVFDDVEGYDRMTGRYSADTPTAKISLKDLLDSKNIVSDYEYEVGHKHGGKVYRRAGGSVRGWGKATRGY